MDLKKQPIIVEIKKHTGVKWYNGRIGQTYNVKESVHPGFKGEYQVIEHESLFIDKQHCTVVKEHKKKK